MHEGDRWRPSASGAVRNSNGDPRASCQRFEGLNERVHVAFVDASEGGEPKNERVLANAGGDGRILVRGVRGQGLDGEPRLALTREPKSFTVVCASTNIAPRTLRRW